MLFTLSPPAPPGICVSSSAVGASALAMLYWKASVATFSSVARALEIGGETGGGPRKSKSVWGDYV